MHLYPHLSHAGTLPTPQEHAAILAAKLSYEHQRTKLAQEIRELQKRLEEAQKQLELLNEQIDTHSWLISPLRRIPPEILRDIFALATPSPLAVDSVTDRILHAPWATMQVCRHWNEVSLMFGSLWSHIAIKGGAFGERPAPALPDGGIPHGYWPGNDTVTYAQREIKQTARSVELLTTQLRRSKDANLYITIGRGVIGPSTSEGYCQPYLRILLPHIHRASYLKAPYYILVDTPSPHPLDRLREIHVDYLGFPTSGEDGRNHMMQNIMHSGATHFSATIHSGFPDGLGGGQLPITFYRAHMLTRLVISTYNGWAQLRPLLPQLQNLTDLRLTEGHGFPNTHHQHPSPPELDPIPLTKLSTLSIICSHPPRPAEILTYIVAPNLRHLSCHAPESIHPIEQFFTASGCKLQTLRIQYDIYESLLNFITSCADTISDIHTLEITHQTDLYTGDPEELILKDANAICLIELLDRSRGGDESGADSTNAPPPGINFLFPQLQILQLQSMKLPAREFIDMLQTRRHPQLRVQLASCSIANAQSIHHSPSDEEAKMEAEKQMRERVIQQDRLILGDDHSKFSEWPGWRAHRRPDIRYPPYKRQLTWAEGLEREPEQKQRLERLVDGGLEMWM